MKIKFSGQSLDCFQQEFSSQETDRLCDLIDHWSANIKISILNGSNFT